MLAYAASRPRIGDRTSSPNALLFIVAAHVAVAAVVMSIKMDLPAKLVAPPIPLIRVPLRTDPPPTPQPPTHRAPTPTPFPLPLHHPDPLPRPDPGPTAGPGNPDTGAGTPTAGLGAGPASDPIKLVSVRHEPYLLTPAAELKPPYPASKLASEEEATLNLRLTINDRGRVVTVDPVGRADPVFVAAARRHLIAHWRYAPASVDGQAVATSLTITLRFQLDR